MAIPVSITVLVVQVECAPTYQIPSEDLRLKLGTIGVVFVSNVPESSFVTFGKRRLAGVSKGMARSAPEGAGLAIYVGGPLARFHP